MFPHAHATIPTTHMHFQYLPAIRRCCSGEEGAEEGEGLRIRSHAVQAGQEHVHQRALILQNIYTTHKTSVQGCNGRRPQGHAVLGFRAILRK